VGAAIPLPSLFVHDIVRDNLYLYRKCRSLFRGDDKKIDE
jgi:hypothetical protein